MGTLQLSDKQSYWFIGAVSAVVPTLVAVLLFLPQKLDLGTDWVYVLPSLHAIVNGTTAVILLLALYFIKQGNINVHKKLMLIAFVLGGIFLVSYVVYHSSVESTKFGDVNGDGTVDAEEIIALGMSRIIYFVILISHICLAAIVLPLVLMSYYYGLQGMNKRHRKLVKYAFPIWFYVSVTGVIVYFMIKPYYQF